MSRKRPAAIGALAASALALVAFLALPSPAAATHTCVSSGSRTVVATRSARVFTKSRIRRPSYRVTAYYGCLYSANLKLHLGDVDRDVFLHSLSPIRLAGRFVAYGTRAFGPAGGESADVALRDLRRGTLRRHAALSVEDDDVQQEVTDLELGSTGSLAWIVRRTTGAGGSGGTVYEVSAVDAGGRRLLDSGPGIDPASLALSGPFLYWLKDGLPQAATLS